MSERIRDAVPHYVSPEPFDPHSVEEMTPGQIKYASAGPLKLMWLRFRRHRLAVVSAVFLLFAYGSTLVTEVLAPYGLNSRDSAFILAPPQTLRFFHKGEFIGPFVYGLDYQLNMETMRREYATNRDKPQPVRFFCNGAPYRFWGLFEASTHIVCPAEGGTLYLLGTDRLGRDMLSRVLYGARISLTIGLIGVAISLALGMLLGGIAGYYGGLPDSIIQRLIEILRSFPELPLWMALSAALPVDWSPLVIYFGITLILGLLDWTGLARSVRSKLMALREEDFCTAAELMGASPKRVIARHMLPNFLSHIIASATLSVPSMILGETALSFLGLGLRPPITSWGVLLSEAQNINVVVLYPWLLLPVVPVILVVLAFNFFGDGLRDAADPYS